MATIKYTNTGLVHHAQKTLTLKTKYMWGGILRPIEKQFNTLYKMYGDKAGTGYTPERWNELKQLCNKGYYGVDCVGLVKSYYWSGKADGGVGSPDYVGNTDVNANRMFELAKKKGKINTLPEIPGLIVYSKSHPHVGIYIGGKYTIESTLGVRGDGVVKRPLDSFWEYWFECPFIEYISNKKELFTTKLLYNAVVRDKPSTQGKQLTKLYINSTITVIKGTEKKDDVSGFTYIQLYNSNNVEQWIVKSAVKM